MATVPTYTGTSGNDSWTVVQGGTFILDGGDGVDTLSLGTSLRNQYTVKRNADGTVSVDTLSGASQALHATLKNMELLTFNSGRDTIDLRTYFGDVTPPTLVSSTPAAGGSNVSVGFDLVLTFSETVVLGTGTIVLKDAAGTTIDAAVSVSGTNVTVNPTVDLAAGSNYTLSVASGAVKDSAGNALAAAASIGFHTQDPLKPDVNNAPVQGTAGNDIVLGDARNNVFVGSAGQDSIDGGDGVDKLVLANARASYTVTVNGTKVTVNNGTMNTVMDHVERIQFGDATVAYDIAGNGGQVYRLYQAAFGRTPDSGGLGYWISVKDAGAVLNDIAGGFVNSAEFQTLYGANPTVESIVTAFYQNVLHRAPEQAGYDYWVGVLHQNPGAIAQVLVSFSESPENQANLAPIIGQGFTYTPFG